MEDPQTELLTDGLNRQNLEVGKLASRAKALILRSVPQPQCYGLVTLRMLNISSDDLINSECITGKSIPGFENLDFKKASRLGMMVRERSGCCRLVRMCHFLLFNSLISFELSFSTVHWLFSRKFFFGGFIFVAGEFALSAECRNRTAFYIRGRRRWLHRSTLV